MALRLIDGGKSEESEAESYKKFIEALHYLIVDSAPVMEQGDHISLKPRKVNHNGREYGNWLLQIRRNDPFRAMFTDRIIE